MGTSFTVGKINEKVFQIFFNFSYNRIAFLRNCFFILVLCYIFLMVDLIQSEKFQKLVFNKINRDLSNTIYHPHGQEIWIIDFDTKDWYFQYLNNGQLWYNQKIFSLNLPLFSLKNTENQKLLKMWFEKNLNLTVNKISRKNSNMEYYIDGVMRNTNYKWSMKNRFGFSYHTVKHYLDLKSHILDENIKLEHFLTENDIY